MKIKITNKISIPVFIILAPILFGATTTFSQTSALRANGKIAFTSDRDGNREIYVMNADGTAQTRLTNNNIADEHPAWSSDGKRIAFISQRTSGGYAIFQMNADGSGKTEITPVNFQPSPYYATGWTISWSPDGSQLAFTDLQGNSRIVVIANADGSSRRVLTNGYGPAWSPDGSKILFITGAFPWSLNTIKPNGTDHRVLPPLPDNYSWYYDATWSPTGSEIVTTAFDGANEIIFISNDDGTAAREFHSQCGDLFLGCSRLAAPSWSPDGKTIAFHVAGGHMEIYVKDIAGGESRRLTNTDGNNTDPSWQPLNKTTVDFDGDGRADISVFRPSDRTWYLNQSTNGFSAIQFGFATDKLTPADYDGDGKTDIAVYRDGTWYWLNSSNGTVSIVQFGLADEVSIPSSAGNIPIPGISPDIPVPADYTGDGRAELAIYRGGVWWTLDLSNNQVNTNQFGLAGDEPVVDDYDGDGRADQAIYRNGEWHLNRSSQGYAVVNFGLATDKLVPADYDGDGKTDQAVYRDGTWWILQSLQGIKNFQWGMATDTPAPADYDGDGKTDAAVFREGFWYLRQSTNGISIQQFGLANDKPVPAAFLP